MRGPAADGDEELVARRSRAVVERRRTGPSARPAAPRPAVRPVTTAMPSASNAAAPARRRTAPRGRAAAAALDERDLSAPSRRKAWAISTPIAPPPSTSSRRGTSFAAVASRLSHGAASAQARDRRQRGARAGGQHDRAPRGQPTRRRRRGSTTTRRAPASRPSPRTSVDPVSRRATAAAPGRPSRRSCRRAGARAAAASTAPVTAAPRRGPAGPPRGRRRAGSGSCWGCSPSRSTRRRPARARRARRAARRRRSRPAATSPAGPAPMTMTSNVAEVELVIVDLPWRG